jgi:mono/diheme cytochrome c family protein
MTRDRPVSLAVPALALALLATAGCKPAPPVDQPLRSVPNGDLQRGRELMSHYQCGSCHAVPGVPGAAATAAPALNGFGRRSYIAGKLPNGPLALQRWLQDPPAAVAGATMPRLGIPAQDARDMAAYLLALE